MSRRRDIPTKFDYKPQPPFAVGTTVYGDFFVKQDLRNAVRVFNDNFTPADIDGETSVWIADSDDVIVLGWTRTHDQVVWFGCSRGFDAWGEFGDLLEVACYELVAAQVVARLEDHFNAE